MSTDTHDPHHETRTRLRAALVSLLTDLPALEEVVPRTAAPPSEGSKKGKKHGPPLPGGTGRLSLLADLYSLATSWCHVVLDERGLDGRTIGDKTHQRLAFLSGHSDWLAESDQGPDALLELGDLAAKVSSLVSPTGVRRIPVGACPVVECPGAVWARITDRHSQDAMPDATCDTDRSHTWPQAHYRRLADMLGTDGPDRVDVPGFVAHLSSRFGRVPRQTVESWVARNRERLGWDPDTRDVDRLRAVSVWLSDVGPRAHRDRRAS